MLDWHSRKRASSVHFIEIGGALQAIEKADHVLIVAIDGGIDGNLRHSAIGNFRLLERKIRELNSTLPGNGAEFSPDGGIARACRRERLFEVIAILLDGGNVIADFLGAVDALLQEVMQLILGGELFAWRVRSRGKLPTVSRKANIREDEKHHGDKNNSFPQSEILPHQVLE